MFFNVFILLYDCSILRYIEHYSQDRHSLLELDVIEIMKTFDDLDSYPVVTLSDQELKYKSIWHWTPSKVVSCGTRYQKM